jgi:hypothetical protein
MSRGGDLDHPAFACERVHDPQYGSRTRRFQGQVKTAKFQTDQTVAWRPLSVRSVSPHM